MKYILYVHTGGLLVQISCWHTRRGSDGWTARNWICSPPGYVSSRSGVTEQAAWLGYKQDHQ